MVELAINKNITMKQYNGTDYDTLYPKTIAEQVDGVYNKEQVASTVTKALFGLGSSAVPDDILAAIGKYKQYWWRRRGPKTTGYIEVQTNVTNHHLVDYSDGSVSYSYGASVSIDQSSGAISINNPTTATFNLYSDFSVLKGKYITSGSTIYYLSADATIKSYKDDDDEYVYVNTCQRITSKYVSGEAGPWQYIQSSNRSAYPDSGTQDGYEYEYLGVPFDNAVTAPKIEVGSYVGTGTYGVNNPNTLTFGFVPKVWGIYAKKRDVIPEVDGGNDSFPWGIGSEIALSLRSTAYLNKVSYTDKTVSWYSTSNAEQQKNLSGYTYYVFAIS